jgi:hypothetical protein
MSEKTATTKKALTLAAIILPGLIVLGQAALLDNYMRWTWSKDIGWAVAPISGMPIDDAYIFKRYAENIAAGNGYSFNPGEVSFGGTSLLWPVVMAGLMKLFFFIDYRIIVFSFGALMAAVSASGAVLIVKKHTGKTVPGLLAGLMIGASPLIFMNAVSGMETCLTFVLLTAFAGLVLSDKPRPLVAGLVAGLLTLNRPEALYFPVGALVAWVILLPFKDKRQDFSTLLKFLIGWAVLAVPTGLIVYAHTGGFMPTTYLGKIMSTAPGVLDRGLTERFLWAGINLGSGWLGLAGYLHPLGAAAMLLIAYKIIAILRSLGKKEPEGWIVMGFLILFGYLFLPGAYGFAFPVGPAFGGYYLRYIAPVFLIGSIIAMTGLSSLYDFISSRFNQVSRYSRIWVPVVLVEILVYMALIWNLQFLESRTVYWKEAWLNEGLRMQAAHWIRDNTPTDAKVMIGYTGLGVVGGNCDRYVLDLGALINPDIFDYYRDAPRDPQGRWNKIVEYMQDRGVTYYVTFAFTKEYAEKIADPGVTPGFSEVARLGAKGEPKSPYEQIRIYKIEWHEWESGNIE